MNKHLYLYKVIKKDTGAFSEGFMTYNMLVNIPNIETDYYIYAIKMDNVTGHIRIEKSIDK